MITRTNTKTNTNKIAQIILMICLVCPTAMFGQDMYHQEFTSHMDVTQAPSEVYYNSHLRAGDEWEEDDGPGGTGNGGNDGVGTEVPVGEGTLALAIGALLYGAATVYRRQRKQRFI